MNSTVNVSELENRIFNLIGNKEYITIDDLIEKISVYELFHLLVLYDEFTKIKVYDFDLNIEDKFNDEHHVVDVPGFKIMKAEVKK